MEEAAAVFNQGILDGDGFIRSTANNYIMQILNKCYNVEYVHMHDFLGPKSFCSC